MKGMWRFAIVVVAILALGGAAVGFVAAQTDGEVPGTDFISRLAAKLGITQEELEEAIDETQLELVDEAVAADKLTEEQADRIRERIESGEGLFPFGGFGRGFALGRAVGYLHASLDDVAEFLGMGVDELRDAMADGQSLAQVAEANGVSADELKAFLLSKVEERVAEAVENGTITQERADEILANALERIDEMINREGSPCPGGGRGHWRGDFGWPSEPEPEDEDEDTSDTTL